MRFTHYNLKAQLKSGSRPGGPIIGVQVSLNYWYVGPDNHDDYLVLDSPKLSSGSSPTQSIFDVQV